MLYIVGGASRSGKSIISRRLLVEKQVPYFPLDVLISSIEDVRNDLGIFHGQDFIQKASQLWKHSITKNLFEHLALYESNYLVEGDCILPEQIHEIQQKFTDSQLRVCFIGYPELTSVEKLSIIRKYNDNLDDWTVKYDDKKMLEYIDEMIEYSKYLKSECEKYNIKFFNVSENFNETQDEIFNFLTK